MENNTHKNTAAILHLSSLSQYFIPFGNFIFPILIWSYNKQKSETIDIQGKQVINFQLSLFLYSLLLCLIAFPILILTVLKNINIESFLQNNEFTMDHFTLGNSTGIVILALLSLLILGFIKIIEFFLIIYAAVKTANGDTFKYPFTIAFIK